MTIASAFSLALLGLFGAAIIVGALNARRLIDWENRALALLADNLRDYRVSLEEEQGILGRKKIGPQAVRTRPAVRGSRTGDKAA